MLPIIEKHEPVPSDDGTMLVTLSDGRREWSAPVTVVRHRGRLASHVPVSYTHLTLPTKRIV